MSTITVDNHCHKKATIPSVTDKHEHINQLATADTS
jgi:hypothetical protein